MKRPFVLKKRGKYWYYRLANETDYHSTGQIRRSYAETWVVNKHNLILEQKSRQNNATGRLPIDVTLCEYIEPLFRWNRCPHVTRLREEGKATSVL